MKFLKRTALLFVVVLLLIVWSIAENILGRLKAARRRKHDGAVRKSRRERTAIDPGARKLPARSRFLSRGADRPHGEYLHLPSLSQTVWWDFLYSAEPRDYVSNRRNAKRSRPSFMAG